MKENQNMEPLPDPSTLFFEREWTFWIKVNNSDWLASSFHKIYVIKTVKDMWGIINNLSSKMLSSVNIFIMEQERIPLVESHGDTFKYGGTWSVVIKKQNWIRVLSDVFVALLGETKFSSSIRGACIVPVNQAHIIVKLWSTDRNENDAEVIESLFGNTTARFKPFDI